VSFRTRHSFKTSILGRRVAVTIILIFLSISILSGKVPWAATYGIFGVQSVHCNMVPECMKHPLPRGLHPNSAPEFPEHPNHSSMNSKSERFNKPASGNGRRGFNSLSWDKPSPTISFGNCEINVHPKERRSLSIFESIDLKVFPMIFLVKGSLTEQVVQLLNIDPTPLAACNAAADRMALPNPT